MLTFCVTLYSLLVSRNIGNLQSLFHGKSQQNTNDKFTVLLTLLFLSGVKMESPTHSWYISAGLNPHKVAYFNFSAQ